MATILVVDDEIGIRELLSEILNDEGHETVLAENAMTARNLYATHQFDLVLLDIWMPDMDGMSLLREWTSAQLLHCPVVMMSGHASIDTAVEAQNLGAVSFLEKPITMHKLLSTVHKVLSKSADKKNTALTPANLTALDTETTAGTNAPITGAHAANGIASLLNNGYLTQAANNVHHVTKNNVNGEQSSFSANSVNSANNLDNVNNISDIELIAHSQRHALSAWHQTLSTTELDTGLREFRESVERVYFSYILQRENWSMTRVAEAAGLERTHLYRKLKQLNIDLPRKAKLP